MRRFEFFLYVVVILFFVVRYAGTDGDQSRRPAPVPGQEAPDETPLPVEDGGPVRVNVTERKGNSVGTAFLVNSSGTYVTARHVVDGCAQVYLSDGPLTMERVRAVEIQRNRDFAVLKTTRFGVTPFNLSDQSPKKGEEGYFMGYPQGKPADIRASVLGRNEMYTLGRYRMREPVVAWVERERRPGFKGSLGGLSGGPVVNAKGYVVGSAVAESPRRGRVYTTNPHVFLETGLFHGVSSDRLLDRGVQASSFDLTGSALRMSNAVAQVYCKAK